MILKVLLIVLGVGCALSRSHPHTTSHGESKAHEIVKKLDLFEGDILVRSGRSNRYFMTDSTRKWPNAIVPYEFAPTVPLTDRNVVLYVFRRFSTVSCVKFVQRTNETDYVYVQNEPYGCYAELGRVGGRQIVNLQTRNCISRAYHEFLHSLGFLHEHTRWDRDQYVYILWNNIEPSTRDNFEIISNTSATTFGVPYDYLSVLHYPNNAFSKDGMSATIHSKNPQYSKLGGESLSKYDIERINKAYCE